jgi:hypothetical protein
LRFSRRWLWRMSSSVHMTPCGSCKNRSLWGLYRFHNLDGKNRRARKNVSNNSRPNHWTDSFNLRDENDTFCRNAGSYKSCKTSQPRRRHSSWFSSKKPKSCNTTLCSKRIDLLARQSIIFSLYYNWNFIKDFSTAVFPRSVLRLLVTASVVPSSPILLTLMKEELSYSETFPR